MPVGQDPSRTCIRDNGSLKSSRLANSPWRARPFVSFADLVRGHCFGCVIPKFFVNVPSLMTFARCLGIILTGAAVLFSISCEKHHLGEYPEVQRDLTAELDKAASNPAPAGSATATPIKFYPEKKAP